ncbi:hypothetical protein BP5796_00382 [Coleophoma crateriformis]|uniref:Uncharacterized protein n=1 Tax=Coleophoma crateriformis TaxID=565419 RepID=A0A3D8T7U0_9HELO|nr:hypothetical protein BP5796_00382 [Coleophoma crateriformis]
MSACNHAALVLEPTRHAREVGYSRPSQKERAAATTSQGTLKSSGKPKPGTSQISPRLSDPATFPAALLLPGDDLAQDPKYPPQSRRAWTREKDRNKVTPERNVIYIAAPPKVDFQKDEIKRWTRPRDVLGVEATSASEPDISAIVSYVAAFYHGIPVKELKDTLKFTKWDKGAARTKGNTSSRSPNYIGLNTSSECTRIRVRATPEGDFSHQLNLSDLLDAAIYCLPSDAYAIFLLVDHDLFEDDDDLFVCGRAYGGSRVAVISTARYRPELDLVQEVEREHAWPASHCETYLQRCCGEIRKPAQTKSTSIQKGDKSRPISICSSDEEMETSISPIRAAVSAHQFSASLVNSPTSETLSGLWLGRVCRTVSHELGHCFGMDHCVYYACVMQGSSSIIEDARQPPYLCPVDLSKVLEATGVNQQAHYQAMLAFCDQYHSIHLFAAYGAWIRMQLAAVHPQDSGS